MVSIQVTLSLGAGILIALIGAIWIFKDANSRNMGTAVDWAVGFFVAFFLFANPRRYRRTSHIYKPSKSKKRQRKANSSSF
jgi:hypothetical protein